MSNERIPQVKKINRIFNLLDDMTLSSPFNTIFSICSLYICMKSLASLCFSKLFLYYSVLCILPFHVYLPSLANPYFEACGKFIYSLNGIYQVPDTPKGSEGTHGASIIFPFGLYFSLKNNCIEQTKPFKLGLETKSGPANFSY